MSDEFNKDLAKSAVETLVKESYSDLAKPITAELGKTGGILLGFFRRHLFGRLERRNLEYDYNMIVFLSEI